MSKTIVAHLRDALQYAHDKGVVHRDIKPENILIAVDGLVQIADFGLSRILGNESQQEVLTATHQVMGTPRYMAPEQLEGSHGVDHRADIYSLGVVIYEILTGELPIGNVDFNFLRRCGETAISLPPASRASSSQYWI